MPKKEYEWEEGSIIGDHSLAKHHALREYLVRFVKALSPNPRQDKINLDIIDGFAGGGIYQTLKGDEHFGSPIIILKGLEEAELLCTEARRGMKKVDTFKVVGNKYFIDSSLSAIRSLSYQLDQLGYSNRIGKDIHIIHQTFEEVLPKILEQLAKKRSKAIFLLDQYGYQDATLNHVQQIFKQLGDRAEVILTLATDNIISYISKDERFRTAVERAKLSHIINDEVIERFRDAPDGTKKQERIAIQYIVANSFHRDSGAKWGNSLFIRSSKSKRAYLYLHLSNSFRAREEMNQVFWDNSNEIVQDAGKGINMFEYNPERDIQSGFEFLFDDHSGSLTIEELERDLIARIDTLTNEISIENFLTNAIQTATPAGLKHFKSAIFNLQRYGELKIINPEGGTRNKAHSIRLKDKIQRSKQIIIKF